MATSFDFPATPAVDDEWTLPGGSVMVWNGSQWVNKASAVDVSELAPKTATRRIATTNTALIATDENNILLMDNSSPVTVNLDQQSVNAYEPGRSTLIIQKGTGSVTLVQGSGATVNVRDAFTLVLAGQNAQVAVTKTGTNEWDVSGDLEPA